MTLIIGLRKKKQLDEALHSHRHYFLLFPQVEQTKKKEPLERSLHVIFFCLESYVKVGEI